MKKAFVIIFILGLVTLITAVCFKPQEVKKDYLRLHIRANSNLEEDQEVKYKVKEAVVEFLMPKVASVETFSEAEKMLEKNLKEIEKIADEVLEKNGFNYKSKANVKKEEFPTRVYDDLTLDAGVYDALIIELGEGVGNNWWCVVYPPLCFVGSNSKTVKYKSKIVEIIEKWREKNT